MDLAGNKGSDWAVNRGLDRADNMGWDWPGSRG